MRPTFFGAAIPEPHTILGLRLRPFTAGHLILLNRIGNVFADLANLSEHETTVPAAEDLWTAVWFCRKSYAEGLADLDNLKQWREQMVLWIRTYSVQFGAIDINAKCKAFARYITDGSSTPQYMPTPQEMETQHELQVPTVQLVKVALLGAHIVQSEAEFLDRPWGLSLWDYFVLSAMKGQGQIYDGSHINDAIAAAVAAGKAIKKEEAKAKKDQRLKTRDQRPKARKAKKKGGRRG